MKRTVELILVSLLAISCPVASLAQPASKTITVVPRLVKLSGSLTDSSAQPLSGVVGVTFALYEEEQGGAPLWMETQNIQTDTNGRYTAMLGATHNEGIPAEVFSSGQGRWLGVQPQGEPERPRVLMVSVPYALKAADAETIGGLPPSAFVLAAPPMGAAATISDGTAKFSMAAPAATPAVSGTGTTDFVPLWTNSSGTLGNSVMFQSGSGSAAKIGINTTTPATTLDVKGTTTVRGILNLPITGTATAAAGDASEPLNLAASAFNSGTETAISQIFRLQAEPAGNNTNSTSGTLNLLYAAAPNTPAETGLRIASNGQITFAPGQTFPGGSGGTVTSVGSGAGLTGGPITGSGTLSIATGGVSNVMLANPSLTLTAGTALTGGGSVALGGSTTLNLDTTKVPQLNTANTFTGNQTVNGNLTATGLVTGSGYQIGSNLFAFGNPATENAFLGFAGNTTTTGIGNTATGFQALAAVTTGDNNAASGYQALQANTTGSGNVAMGLQTLKNNTGGGNNIAIGGQALLSNTTGGNNIALGNAALIDNLTGVNNIAIGYQPLYYNETGTDNIAIGLQTLDSNSNGSFNTATGESAMGSNISGSYNTAAGYTALFFNSTGSYNTAVGSGAGNPPVVNYQAGNYNTFIGYNTSVTNGSSISNATAIGATAAVGESNALTLGGIGANAVSVGIGTSTPFNDYALDVEATPGGVINGGVVSNATGGNIYLGMTNGAHKFRVDTNGVAYADGGFQSSGADFAESFAVRGQRSGYEPGDLLVIDARGGRRLSLAQAPYSTMIAGIYSTKPGLLASPHNIDDARPRSSEVPLAVVGTVPGKVTAENGPIKVGDLLVASSRPGYAMKGTNRKRMLGAVVGKALEPLPKGTGVIEVLVTLQ
jgi:hypothetical protein